MIAFLICAIRSLDPANVSEAKAVLRKIQQIRGNLTRHISELTRFAQNFRILTEDDKKVKAKIAFMQNIVKVHPQVPVLTEVPLSLPKSGPPYIRPISTTFSRFLPWSSPYFEFQAQKEIAAKKMLFDAPFDLSCQVTTFSITFRFYDGSTIELKPLTLGAHEFANGIEYPMNILFQQITIIPLTNQGNETHNCFPGFHLYGFP